MPGPKLSGLALASALSLFSLPVSAMNKIDLLIGSYTQGSSQGIYRMAFNSETGVIDIKPRQVVQADNPSWLVLSTNRQFLFSVNENGPGQRDELGQASSYGVNPDTHELIPLSRAPTQGDEPTHASLTADQRFLLVANYAVKPTPGGSLAVLPLSEQGQLGDAVQVLGPNPPSKVNAERQASSHVHSVVPTPDGRYVVAADLGADRLFVYRYDGEQAQPLQPVEQGAVVLPDGSGPRHLLFSADGRHAWLTLEMTAQVVVFEYHDGALRKTQTVDLRQPGVQLNGASGLHASADGRFLYVANRGDANELVVFSIDSHTGALKEIQRRAVEGREPREFSLDPSGRFLLIANQKSNQVVTMERDPKTGLLGKTVQTLEMDAPSALVFMTP